MNDLRDYLKQFKSLEAVCRICLTQSKKMVTLNSALNSETDSPSIIEALQIVASDRVIICDEKYPNALCPMCMGLLKLSYDLKSQFETSEKILQDHFKNSSETPHVEEGENCSLGSKPKLNREPQLSPVEIIVGPNKYSLNDIVIVEEDKEDKGHFKGFLENLGKTISARFVNKSYKPNPINIQERPIVLIEKIGTKDCNTTMNINNTKKSSGRLKRENIDKYIISEDDYFNKASNPNIFKRELNWKGFGLNNPSDIDLELFQSALSMQLKCEICQKLYSSKGRFKNHLQACGKLQYRVIQNKSGPHSISVASSILGCHICSRTFKQRKFLNYHIKTVHDMDSRYTCEICGHTVCNRNTFLYHMRTRHGERNFTCEICGKKFFTSSSLKTHILNHTQRNVAQCICPVCGKTFHYKGGLFYHMKVHTNERKYCCEYCDKKFYTSVALKRHTLTHTGVRPYACQFCEKKFCSSGEVRKHEYTHTGVRPFRCQYCRKGFCSAYNLKVHLVSHPGPYSCKLCGRTFVTNNVLQFHEKIKHSSIEKEDPF